MGISESSRRSPKLVERSHSFNFATRKDDALPDGIIIPYEDAADRDVPAAKRVCSGEGKENVSALREQKPAAGLVKAVPLVGLGVRTAMAGEVRSASAMSGAGIGSGKGVRSRVGLRRL